ncbi:hypothetical protein PPERSA_04854 [Pseudocohnilembus persalinus]|uniref:Uncharacterized protein n=1 Tax=Pseudocohnilembus persalinus TaxID=266149 RepID=A0A0V0QJE3_PSEPJ|nr:hypothetical protein PPERSA_04854 [Pseudocohnilembus persalinus]|eukprot:KRX02232.1 hypothetical protein PPERSA_04854 [Pseudocohnilembus persalinus]
MSNLIYYPYCEKEGFHSGEVLNQICLESKCRDKLLCCDICATEQHKDHKTQPIKLFLQQIREQNNECNQEAGNQYEQEQIINYIQIQKDATLCEFNQLQSQILNEMQKIEKNLTKSFDLLLENYIKQGPTLSHEELQNIIDSIYLDENNKENFYQKFLKLMEFLPKYEDRQGKKLELMKSDAMIKSIEKHCVQLQKQFQKETLFKEIKNIDNFIKYTIDQKIQSNKIFYVQSLEYLFKKHKNATSLLVHEEGIDYETAGSTQLIYSEDSFENGIHGYSMEITKMKQNCTSCFLIGVYTEEDAEQNKNTGPHPWACLFNSCRGKMKPGDKNFTSIIKPGDLIKVQLNIEQNTFTISDEGNKLTYFLPENTYDMKGKKLKFFISFYSADSEVRIKIVETY